MEISIDDAVAALVAEAERHEEEHNAEFCVDTRISLLVFVMMHLDLELADLGFIAEAYVAMRAELEEEDEQEKQEEADHWDDVIGCSHSEDGPVNEDGRE